MSNTQDPIKLQVRGVLDKIQHGYYDLNDFEAMLTDLKSAEDFAALSRLEAAAAAEYERGRQDGMKQGHAMWELARLWEEIESAAVPVGEVKPFGSLRFEVSHMHQDPSHAGVRPEEYSAMADACAIRLTAPIEGEAAIEFARKHGFGEVPIYLTTPPAPIEGGRMVPVAWSIKCNGHHTGNIFINKEKALTRADELCTVHPQDIREVVALVEAAPQPGDKA